VTLEHAAAEGERIARAADGTLRLLGGVAVWVRCPSARVPPLARDYGDADFAGRARERTRITELLTGLGYEPDKMFNALHGAARLNFTDPVRGRPLDVLLDRFAMCHELDLRESRSEDGLTIDATDLLLTKLQVVDLNDKDLRDIAALLLDTEPDPERLAHVTHADWGLEHTIHRTLATVRERAAGLGLAPERTAEIAGATARIAAALDAAPKSAKWRMRARVGERKRWYQQPEEARA
jgi:hypothetical protein